MSKIWVYTIGCSLIILISAAGCTTLQRPEPFTQKWAKAVEKQPDLNSQDRSRSFARGKEAPPGIIDEDAGPRSQPPRDRMEIAYRIGWHEGAKALKEGQ
jgi:hypothetical protein